MRRAASAAVLLAAITVAACGGGGGGSDDKSSDQASAAKNAKPVNITLWVGFEQRELGVVKQAVEAFHRAHPNINVKTVGAVSDAAGNSLPAIGLAAYWYWNDRPAAELINATMNSSGWNFSVRYSDDHGISLSSIHSGNIEGANIVGSPVVNADGSRWRNSRCPVRICCCSTSRPTTWTLIVRKFCRMCWQASMERSCW